MAEDEEDATAAETPIKSLLNSLMATMSEQVVWEPRDTVVVVLVAVDTGEVEASDFFVFRRRLFVTVTPPFS